MIYIDSRKKAKKTLDKKYPNAHIVDVTSKATTGLVKLSPFYPHGDIPIPFTLDMKSMCVEGVWQGLKVFQNQDVDLKSFENDKMKNIKRTVRKYGMPLGHRKGVYGEEILGYIDARIELYLPTYLWMLENKAQYIVDKLRVVSKTKDIVLLDYTTNCNVLDPKKPLSHAFLVKAYVDEVYPKRETLVKQKDVINNSEIDMKLIYDIWESLPEKVLSKQIKIRLNQVQKIKKVLQYDRQINLEKLREIKGIGNVTINKIESFLSNEKLSKKQKSLFD